MLWGDIMSKKDIYRDFRFYLSNRRVCRIGTTGYRPQFNGGAPSAIEAFRTFDSSGILPLECRHPRVFQAVHRAKGRINLQIKMWAEGQADVMIPISEYIEVFTNPPGWVEKAIRGAIAKESWKKYRDGTIRNTLYWDSIRG